MAATADLDRLLEHFEPRLTSRLSPRERLVEGVMAGLLVAIAVAVAKVVDSEQPWSWGTVIALVVCYAGARRAQFQVGPGYTTPSELIFVPMLFSVPLGALPLIVMVAHALSQLPAYATGRRHPEKLVLDVNDSWYVLGPVAVLAATGAQQPDWGDWPIYVGALGAQFAVDLVAAIAREGLGIGAPARAIALALPWAWLVDGLLAPAGLLAAFATQDQPYAFLLVAPLPVALAIFAGERRRRLAAAVELRAARAEIERREDHRREALEINDAVVQHLAVASYLLARGDDEQARGLVDKGLRQAKRIIGDLLHDSTPGEMRRAAAASDELTASSPPGRS
jgi:signal transduction histidine kinase